MALEWSRGTFGNRDFNGVVSISVSATVKHCPRATNGASAPLQRCCISQLGWARRSARMPRSAPYAACHEAPSPPRSPLHNMPRCRACLRGACSVRVAPIPCRLSCCSRTLLATMMHRMGVPWRVGHPWTQPQLAAVEHWTVAGGGRYVLAATTGLQLSYLLVQLQPCARQGAGGVPDGRWCS